MRKIPLEYFDDGYYRKFRPDWLQTYINHYARTYHIPFDSLITLCEMGYQVDKDILKERLPYSLTHKEQFTTDHLYQSDFCIDLLWEVFTEPSEIHLADRYEKRESWIAVITQLVNHGRLDRQRVLRECLLTSTRNFNKLAVGWFFTLFESLNPDPDEIESLLPELMRVLNCPHSKPINTVLKHFEALCTHVTFPTDEFLAGSAILFTSEVKSVVNNTLTIFDKLATSYPNRQTELCEIATNALIYNDGKVQTRVAKFLIKYGNTDDANLRAQIAPYYSDLFSSVKILLAPFSEDLLGVDANPETDTPFIPITFEYLRDDNRIDYPQTFDDQLFFITQAFENNAPWHFDVYLQTIITLIPQINADNIEQLAPAVKNAQRTMTSWNNRIGVIEKIMAKQFIELTQTLVKQFDCQTIEKIHQSIQPDQRWHESAFGNQHLLDGQDIPTERVADRIFTELALYAQTLANSHNSLPILSTPTHSPCFITLEVLCKRLSCYQQSDMPVNPADFQVAIARTIWTNNTGNTLTGEYADIINYLTQDTSLDLAKCQTLALWTIAVYRKNKDLNIFIQHFSLQADLSMLIEPITWHIIQVEREKYGDKSYRFTKLLSRQANDGKITQQLTYHQDFIRNKHSLEVTDTDKLIGITPFNPTLTIKRDALEHVRHGGSYTSEVEDTQMISRVLPMLMQTWDINYDETCYLFLACVLLNSKKQNTQLASELWLQKVSENNMDSQQLGRILGKLEHDDYAPLKRFTDLITAHLMNVSTYHKQSLITLLTAMIAEMRDTPIKGVKKLLELYVELLTVTKSTVPKEVEEKLAMWAEVKSLKPIIKKLTA